MLKIIVVIGASVSLLAALPAHARAAILFAQAYPHTGEIRLLNQSASPVPIVFYSIEANSGTLNSSPAVWKSITDNYDAPFGLTPGNGLVDPNNEWMKISTAPTELTEGVFSGPGGSLTQHRAISLGRIWNPATTPLMALAFSATEPNGQPISIQLAQAVDGDYSRNGVVDAADYVVWRKFFGLSSASALVADGNLNGVVDAADYVVWRNNFGLSASSFGLGLSSAAALPALVSGAAVPEPASAILCITDLAFLMCSKRRRRLR